MPFYGNVTTSRALLLKIQIKVFPPPLIPIRHPTLLSSQRCILSMHQKIQFCLFEYPLIIGIVLYL